MILKTWPESNTVLFAEYNTRSTTLRVTLHNWSGVYRNVPPQVGTAFLIAPSKGAFFNAVIRDRYEVAR
jgi:hypothetical protein